MKRGLSKWALLAVIFVVMVVGDQWSKFLAVDRLTWAFPRVKRCAAHPPKSLFAVQALASAPSRNPTFG